jgi:hypothetical protein
MTPMAHPAPARRYQYCGGCRTCRPRIDWDGLSRHDWPLALGIIVVFIAVFVIPTLLGWHP